MSNPTIAETISANLLGVFNYRQAQIADLAAIIAPEITLPADAVQWRDVFCHECDGNESINGTTQQLAEKLFDLGWVIENPKLGNLNCPTCQNLEPVSNEFWAAADARYEHWKDSRFEN